MPQTQRPEDTRLATEKTPPAGAYGEDTLELSSRTPSLREDHAYLREQFLEGKWQPYAPLPSEVSPSLVPGCTLQAVIGNGGMGTVYLARQNALNRQVAVKVLNSTLTDDPAFIARLRQEAQIMGTLSHPNLVGCHDILVSKDGACVIMEYIPGHLNGRSVVRLLGPMPERYVVSVMSAVARGLSYAHERGFIHRDVKPDNILFAFSGNRPPESYQELFEAPEFKVALCDFGIAVQNLPSKDTPGKSASVIGSPLYMAPEQVLMPEEVDCRSDIYSLGATAFFLLTGRPPFPGKNVDEILELKTQCDLPLPLPPAPSTHLEPELGRAIQKMGANRQEKRFQSYRQLLETLERLETIFAPNLTFRFFTFRYRRFLRRIGALAILAGFLGLAGIYAYTWWMDTYYQKMLFANTTSLARWSGDLSSWQQVFEDGSPVLVAGMRSGAITLKEKLLPGDFLRFSLCLQDIGSTTLFLHDAGAPAEILARITCYRKDDGNVVRLDMLRETDQEIVFREIPMPASLPDQQNQWLHLQIQLYPDCCILWNQKTPLGICHFPKIAGKDGVQFTVVKNTCSRLLLQNIAHLHGKYARRIHDENSTQELPAPVQPE